MKDAERENTTPEADVFSRGTLNLTYELLRKKDAELALIVRNISQGEPVFNNSKAVVNHHSDFFKVGLSSFQVRAIVESLMSESEQDPGRIVVARALVEDWMKLAHKLIAELMDDEKPPIN